MKSPSRKRPRRFGHETLFQTLKEAANAAVAQRAYALFTERGCEHGHDLEDWLAAEKELLSLASPAVTLEGEDVVVRLHATGFCLADLEWDIQRDSLSVTGRQERTAQGSDAECSYSETRMVYLLESVELPEAVDPAEARITMVNDVVEVRLPRRQPMARSSAHAA